MAVFPIDYAGVSIIAPTDSEGRETWIGTGFAPCFIGRRRSGRGRDEVQEMRQMSYMTTMILMFGIAVSTVAGMVCYLGTGTVESQFDWVPCLSLLACHPKAALGLGSLCILLGILCQPSRTP